MHAPAAFFEISMRTIGAIFLFYLFVIAGSAPAFSYGAVAIGIRTSDSQQDYAVKRDEPSAESARSKALEACNSFLKLKDCKITHEFADSYLFILRNTFNGKLHTATGSTPFEAQSNAKYFGTLSNDESYCDTVGSPYWIDKTPVSVPRQLPVPKSVTAIGRPILSPADIAQQAPSPLQPEPQQSQPIPPLREAQNVTPTPPIVAPMPPLLVSPIQAATLVTKETGIIEFRYLTYLSFAILALLFMWLLWALSIRTPPNVLHTYLMVAAWTGVPLLFALGGQTIPFDGSPQRYVWNVLAPAFVQLYAVVYLLLYIGNRLRMTVSPHEAEGADHVFLRLPALSVVIPLAAAFYFSQHQFKTEAEFAICALMTLAVFGIGYFIRPYQAAQPATAPAPVETVQAQEQQATIELPSEVTEAVAVPANNLPAIIPETAAALEPMPPLEGIVLKLKRSQKNSAMGALIYMLDARIDASQETLNLIVKHSLGSRVIYESEARQVHRARAKGHLEDTRGGPGLLAPASEQAKGAAKTMWKIGRAAVSAVRASLALRITVNSLLSGVHVECKSMEELLEAEEAIREAKDNLEAFIETAKTFDGREEVL